MKYFTHNRYLSAVALFLLMLLAAALPAGATVSPGLIQSYNADASVLPGMVVELKSGNSNTVTPLASQDIKHMLGVVVPVNDAAISLTPQSASTQQVLVAVSGRYSLLVSDQNGGVKAGDYLVASTLSGIVMKADSSQSQVVGRAVSGFDGKSGIIGTVPLGSGSNHTADVGRLSADIQLAPSPLYQNNSSVLPSFLTKTASGVANKPVAPFRIYLSMFLLLTSFIMAGTMLYASVQSGIMAVGRNPLAKRVINRSLLQTIIVGLIIFAGGVVSAYLILSI